MDPSTRDLVCLHLAAYEEGPDDDAVPEAVTVLGIGDALEVGTSVADRTDLLVDLRSLRDEGLLRERIRPVETTGHRRRAYFLTDEGRRRAATVREAVEDRSVVVTNGVTEEVSLGAVDRYFDDAGLVRALARLTDDGTVPLGRHRPEAFVGRTGELAALEAAVEDLHARGGQAVLVTGAPGAGKTALVEAFRARLGGRDPGPAVGIGACDSDAGGPYRPFREAFADLPVEADLAALLDDAASLPGDAPDAVEARRRTLFADVADALRSLADRRAVVLVVEDLHWADRATVDLLAFLVENVAQWLYPVLFVVTARPEALDPGHPAGDFLGTLREEAAEWLDLGPLDRSGTRGILERTLETGELPDAFVAAVHEHTGGNPLFVTESAKHLLETGAVDPAADRFPTDPAGLAVPETVAQVVDPRLDALDETGRQVLALGAAVGEAFSAAVLSAASDLPDPELRDYVDLLVEASVWERDGDRLRFVHGVVRRAVLDRLDPATYRTTHRRVAAAVEAVHEGAIEEYYGEVARHYREAGDAERAFDYYRRAGDRAADVFAHDLALGAYGEALAQARERGDADAATEILESVGEIHALRGEHREATHAFERVHRTADGVEARQRAARKLAELHRWWDDHAAAVETADRGLALGGAAPETPEECRLLLAKADALANTGEMPRARALYDEALALARRLDDRRLLADALRERANAVWRQTPEAVDDETVDRMEEAIDLLEETGDEPALARAIDNLGTIHFYRGDLPPSREYTTEALERMRAVGARKWALAVHYNLAVHLTVAHVYADGDADEAMAAIEAVTDEARALSDEGILARIRMVEALLLWRGYGRGDAALSTAADALERARDLGLARWQLHANNILATLALAVADDLDRAREHAHRLVAVAREADRSVETALGTVLLGAIDRETGHHEAARARLGDAVETAAAADAPFQELTARTELVRAHLALDDVEAARAEVRAVEALLDGDAVGADNLSPWKRGLRWPEVRARGARPRLARAEGDHERAVAGFAAAREVAREAGDRRSRVEFGHELGVTCRLAGDRDRARRALQEARDLAVDADYRRLRRKCDRELARLENDE